MVLGGVYMPIRRVSGSSGNSSTSSSAPTNKKKSPIDALTGGVFRRSTDEVVKDSQRSREEAKQRQEARKESSPKTKGLQQHPYATLDELKRKTSDDQPKRKGLLEGAEALRETLRKNGSPTGEREAQNHDLLPGGENVGDDGLSQSPKYRIEQSDEEKIEESYLEKEDELHTVVKKVLEEGQGNKSKRKKSIFEIFSRSKPKDPGLRFEDSVTPVGPSSISEEVHKSLKSKTTKQSKSDKPLAKPLDPQTEDEKKRGKIARTPTNIRNQPIPSLIGWRTTASSSSSSQLGDDSSNVQQYTQNEGSQSLSKSERHRSNSSIRDFLKEVREREEKEGAGASSVLSQWSQPLIHQGSNSGRGIFSKPPQYILSELPILEDISESESSSEILKTKELEKQIDGISEHIEKNKKELSSKKIELTELSQEKEIAKQGKERHFSFIKNSLLGRLFPQNSFERGSNCFETKFKELKDKFINWGGSRKIAPRPGIFKRPLNFNANKVVAGVANDLIKFDDVFHPFFESLSEIKRELSKLLVDREDFKLLFGADDVDQKEAMVKKLKIYDQSAQEILQLIGRLQANFDELKKYGYMTEEEHTELSDELLELENQIRFIDSRFLKICFNDGFEYQSAITNYNDCQDRVTDLETKIEDHSKIRIKLEVLLNKLVHRQNEPKIPEDKGIDNLDELSEGEEEIKLKELELPESFDSPKGQEKKSPSDAGNEDKPGLVSRKLTTASQLSDDEEIEIKELIIPEGFL